MKICQRFSTIDFGVEAQYSMLLSAIQEKKENSAFSLAMLSINQSQIKQKRALSYAPVTGENKS